MVDFHIETILVTVRCRTMVNHFLPLLIVISTQPLSQCNVGLLLTNVDFHINIIFVTMWHWTMVDYDCFDTTRLPMVDHGWSRLTIADEDWCLLTMVYNVLIRMDYINVLIVFHVLILFMCIIILMLGLNGWWWSIVSLRKKMYQNENQPWRDINWHVF